VEPLGAFDDVSLQIRNDFINEVMQDASLNKVGLTKSQLHELADIILRQVIYEAEEELKRGILIPNKKRYLYKKCKEYIDAIKHQLARFMIHESIYAQIRGYRIFMIIGAGFSTEGGVPLAKHLGRMLECKNQKEFKNQFLNFLQTGDVRITDAHFMVAREFFSERKIIEIICLNWDNFIEDAFRKMCEEQRISKDIANNMIKNRKINREEQQAFDDDNDGFYHYIWKFCGDVEDLDYRWILPGEEERIFSSFIKYFEKFKENSSVIMLIVGYSERYQEKIGQSKICREIIKPLEDKYKWKTFRVGLDLELFHNYRDNYIVAPANWFIPLLFERI
jgi:hypothetical protein